MYCQFKYIYSKIFIHTCLIVSCVTLFNSEKYKYLLEIAQSFATYWRTGYHEDFGRDRPVDYPSIVKDAGLCHVHILLGDISQRAQDLWDKNNIPINKGSR